MKVCGLINLTRKFGKAMENLDWTKNKALGILPIIF